MTKYETIARKLTEYINDERTYSRKLPTERELCSLYGVSRQTIREALLILEKDNIITKIQGSGIYINEQYFSLRNRIAVILKEEDEYIYPEWISLFKSSLKQQGYSAQFFFTHNNPLLERECLSTISSEHFRGIISEPVMSIYSCPNRSIYETLRSEGIPTIFFMGSYPNMTSFQSIKYDDYSACYSLTKELCGKNIPIYSIFPADDNNGKYRYEGYMQALIESSHDLKDSRTHFILSDDIQLIRRNLRPNKLYSFLNGITEGNLICHNDEVAMYAYKVLSEKNIDNISIYSFDKSYVLRLAKGKINSYAPDKNELINETVIGIISLINNKTVKSRMFNPYIHGETFPESF